jgi:hypothetical protein
MLNEEIQKAYTKYGRLETEMKYTTLGMIMTDLHKETKLDLLEGHIIQLYNKLFTVTA